MRRTVPVGCLVISLVAAACAPAPVAPGRSASPLARLRAATAEEARTVLGRSDAFTARMTPADRSFRTKQPGPVTEAAMLSFAAAQAQAWTAPELAVLDRIRGQIEAGLAKRGLDLDAFLTEDVLVIKSTGAEEFGFPYTRQNAIVIPADRLDDPAPGLPLIVTHELWHVMSRHSPALRDASYAVIGTAPAPGFTVPAELAARHTTNPDGVDVAFRMQVMFGDRAAWVMPLIDFKAPGFTAATAGGFMDWLELRFLEMAPDAAGAWQPVRDASGALVVHDPGATPFAPCYGMNTQEIVHPDEIAATSFALMVAPVAPASPPATPALLEDLAHLIGDGARHPPEVRCRY
jgi:hypothetical protein